MYTWGYIKQVALAKLDIPDTSNQAEVLELVNRFPYYANEAITQICSAIKPKYAYAEFVITEENVTKNMPNDFVSFGGDINYIEETMCGKKELREANDDDFVTHGYKTLLFKHKGRYLISYNARWINFVDTGNGAPIDDNYELDIPEDILDCIPSYIASQCYKIDDEYKAQTYRNEYELMLARIDDTNYKNTKTIHIRGGW